MHSKNTELDLSDHLSTRQTTLKNIKSTLLKNKLDFGPKQDDTVLYHIIVHEKLIEQRKLFEKRTFIADVRRESSRELENIAGCEIQAIERGEGRCAITQQVISTRWVGKCGHIYEKNAVEAYMKTGRHACVVQGCDKKLVQLLEK